jgi:hypothetical protein
VDAKLRWVNAPWVGAVGIAWILVVGGLAIAAADHAGWRTALAAYLTYGLAECLAQLLRKQQAWKTWLKWARILTVTLVIGTFAYLFWTP